MQHAVAIETESPAFSCLYFGRSSLKQPPCFLQPVTSFSRTFAIVRNWLKVTLVRHLHSCLDQVRGPSWNNLEAKAFPTPIPWFLLVGLHLYFLLMCCGLARKRHKCTLPGKNVRVLSIEFKSYKTLYHPRFHSGSQRVNKQHHSKVLLNGFLMNRHTLGFCP